MSIQYLWRVQRTDNDQYETTYSSTEPLVAPSDSGAIDTSKTTQIFPRFAALESDGYVIIDSLLADNQAIKITNSDPNGGIDIDVGFGGLTIDSTNVISLDAAAMINITSTAGNIEIDSAGLVEINSASGINIGNDAVAIPVNIGTGAASRILTMGNATGATQVDILTGTGGFHVDPAAGGTISLNAFGASSNFSLVGTADAQDLTVALTGGWNGSLNLTSTGTSASAIVMAAVNAGGGINIDASTGGFRVDTTGVLYLASNALTGGDITLDTAGGGGGINISSGPFGIAINSNNGLIGIGHWNAGDMLIGTSAVARTITLGNATGATAIDVNTGTGGFTLDTTSGGPISLDAVGAASNFTVATSGSAQDLTLAVTGATDSSVIINSSGTGTDAIRFNATAGGIEIDAAGIIDIATTSSASNAIRILATGGMDVDLGASGFDLDTSGVISLATNEGSGGSITLDAATNNGGINVSAGSQGISINATGSGTVGIGHWSGGPVLLGTAAIARDISIGNNTGASSLTLRYGTGWLRMSQPAPTTLANSDATLTITQLKNGILTITPTVLRTLTFPTAALAVAGLPGIAVDDAIDFSIINLAAATSIQIAAGSGGALVVGSSTITGTNAKRYRVRFTNVTASSEAYTIYQLT